MSRTLAPRSVMSRFFPRKANDWVRQAVEQVTYPPDLSAEDVALCESVADPARRSV